MASSAAMAGSAGGSVAVLTHHFHRVKKKLLGITIGYDSGRRTDEHQHGYSRMDNDADDVEAAEQRQQEGGAKPRTILPPGIICPDNPRYLAFWYITIAAAAWTGVIKAYTIAFEPPPSKHPFDDMPAINEYVLSAIFLADMILKFRLAYRKNEQLIGDPSIIRTRYLSTMFWIDLIALLPLDFVVMCATVYSEGDVSAWALEYFQMFRMLRLLRMYRVPQFFLHLEYKLSVSLLAVTLVRNFVFTYFSVHWSACTFYYIARQYGLGKDTWIGHHTSLLKNSTEFERYIYSLYWSITTLATVGYGDFTAENVPETVWATVYMFYNLGLSAYILGSFTLIVIRGDERVGIYRGKCSNLREYSAQNRIPKELRDSMQSHLRLHFETEEASDEAVLAAYPATIRRRILRHLYSGQLRRTYLLQGCKQKFVDALLAVSRIDCYMPNEDILLEGDYVNELFMVVNGSCEVVSRVSVHHPEDVPLANDGTTSVHDGHQHQRCVNEGEIFGEIAFFTEVPQLEGVRACSVARVLSVPRNAYNGTAAAFPLGARSLLENLRVRAQQMVDENFRGTQQQWRLYTEMARMGSESLLSERGSQALSSQGSLGVTASTDDLAALSFAWASPELMPDSEGHDDRQIPNQGNGDCGNPVSSAEGDTGGTNDGGSRRRGGDGGRGGGRGGSGSGRPPRGPQRGHGSSRGLTPKQEQVIAGAMRVRALVSSAVAKSDEQRTNQFLSAASHGDTDTVLQMLQQGFDCQKADYDGRNALMLAAAKGHTGVARLLISANVDVNASDLSGGTALDEACSHANDDLIALLNRKGAKLGGKGVRIASQLCTAVFEGDLPLLRRLLRAGALPDECDYDKRTALHIAAAEGNLLAVKLLVNEGRANTKFQDRWGRTALQEARRVRAAPVVDFLQPRTPAHPRQSRGSSSGSGGGSDGGSDGGGNGGDKGGDKGGVGAGGGGGGDKGRASGDGGSIEHGDAAGEASYDGGGGGGGSDSDGGKGGGGDDSGETSKQGSGDAPQTPPPPSPQG